jgi:hypothetical protein
MSQQNIRRALEKRLAALDTFDTQYENVTFSPRPGVPYQRVNLLPANVDNTTVGNGYFRDQGIFQIMLCYPSNGGTAGVEARIEQLRNHFKRATALVEGGQSITVFRTPSVAVGFVEQDRFCVAVSVPYISHTTSI